MSYGMLQLMHPLGLGAFVPAMFYMAASVLTLITAVGIRARCCSPRAIWTRCCPCRSRI
ncbi:MAG: hypothetical protein ACLUFV_09350 [Acutalibacteraceae bacterium]